MGNLEHNIKEAFQLQDANTKLADKNVMWNRLDGQLGRRKGVAALWRVAAVLLGVFLLTGTFAAVSFRAKQQTEIEKLATKNVSLCASIDSLLVLPTTTNTEIQIVEKEKIVYLERKVVSQKIDSQKYWEKRYSELADSAGLILASNKKQEHEIIWLNKELNHTNEELKQLQQNINITTANKKAAPFELKSERVDVDISKKPAIKNQDVKMKVFQKNFIENRNNLNSTIFRK